MLRRYGNFESLDFELHLALFVNHSSEELSWRWVFIFDVLRKFQEHQLCIT